MLCLALGFGLLGAIILAKAHRYRHHAYAHGGCGGGGPGCGHHDGHHGGHHGGHGGWRRHGGWHRGGARRWFVHRTLARIDATPAQERALVAELDTLEQRLRAARGALTALRPALADALRSPELDGGASAGLEAGIDAAVADARAALTDGLRRIHALLDDKQRATLAELLGGGGGAGPAAGPYRV
ncbi:MAG: hypothetical protein IPL61_22270 [Myxococcales bacterium]|nr:hypothetical protein [Myxococcales bacterium]